MCDAEEVTKIIAATSGGLVLIAGALFAGARASLCRKVACKSCCCAIDLEREPPK
jgi:hypothetical protein